MILAAALLAATPIVDARLGEAANALQAGRVEQARLMVAHAVGDGAEGEPLERLLADLAAAQGRSTEALGRYQALLAGKPDDAALLERAAATAWKIGRRDLTSAYAARATHLPGASWRAWNLVAMVADAERNWVDADRAYAHALRLAPGQAELLNNKGWSHLLRGEWDVALTMLEQALAAAPSRPLLHNNLEFARAGMADDLPARRPGEADQVWAARLNDAGVAARMRNEPRRALAAFTRAIEARTSWYTRAQSNLERLQLDQR